MQIGQPFSRNVADKKTKKQGNKERKKSPEYNTPSPYQGWGKNCVRRSDDRQTEGRMWFYNLAIAMLYQWDR